VAGWQNEAPDDAGCHVFGVASPPGAAISWGLDRLATRLHHLKARKIEEKKRANPGDDRRRILIVEIIRVCV